MSHHCSSALLRCMDFRLDPETTTYFREKGLIGDMDIISVAGASKAIAQTKESFPEIQIDLSMELHGIETLYVMHHSDCGAYGGKAATESPEQEKEMHLADMRIAKEKILQKHPSLNIVFLYAILDVKGKVILIEEVF